MHEAKTISQTWEWRLGRDYEWYDEEFPIYERRATSPVSWKDGTCQRSERICNQCLEYIEKRYLQEKIWWKLSSFPPPGIVEVLDDYEDILAEKGGSSMSAEWLHDKKLKTIGR